MLNKSIDTAAIPVLDQGHVRVVDIMGNDRAVVQAARVSYGRGTKSISKDRGLIRYLMRHNHTSPFEMCEIKLHIKCPIYVFRQWIRHRTASVNELSGRYSVIEDRKEKTEVDKWRMQSASNKQGSSEQYIDPSLGKVLACDEAGLHNMMQESYEHRLRHGVAREQARKDLPLSTYTEAYWKIDLHNLLNFLELRLDDGAQYEIRSYARVIADIVQKWVPHTWEAFCDYRLNAMKLSAIDLRVIQDVKNNVGTGQILQFLEKAKLVDYEIDDQTKRNKIKRNRELEELEKKIARFDLMVPWRSMDEQPIL